jgi:NAD(P)-dependent dehydrogenase (short-subunit alcohol dehydrogenase family)
VSSSQGHKFLQEVVRSKASGQASSVGPSTCLRIYICTRRPPPPKELELFVLRTVQPNPGWFASAPDYQDPSTADDILDRIKLYHIPLDLTSTKSVIDCARRFLQNEKNLDILLLNAAVAPRARKLSDAKLGGSQVEESMMTNVLGHALLVDCLKSAFHDRSDEHETRVVTVSSELHRKMQASGKMSTPSQSPCPLLTWTPSPPCSPPRDLARTPRIRLLGRHAGVQGHETDSNPLRICSQEFDARQTIVEYRCQSRYVDRRPLPCIRETKLWPCATSTQVSYRLPTSLATRRDWLKCSCNTSYITHRSLAHLKRVARSSTRPALGTSPHGPPKRGQMQCT